MLCLQSTDKELLNFGKDSDDEVDSDDELGLAQAEEDEEEGDEEAEEQGGTGQQQQGKERSGVTLAMVDGWCAAARDKASIGAVRNIIKVRVICLCMCLCGCGQGSSCGAAAVAPAAAFAMKAGPQLAILPSKPASAHATSPPRLTLPRLLPSLAPCTACVAGVPRGLPLR